MEAFKKGIPFVTKQEMTDQSRSFYYGPRLVFYYASSFSSPAGRKRHRKLSGVGLLQLNTKLIVQA